MRCGTEPAHGLHNKHVKTRGRCCRKPYVSITVGACGGRALVSSSTLCATRQTRRRRGGPDAALRPRRGDTTRRQARRRSHGTQSLTVWRHRRSVWRAWPAQLGHFSSPRPIHHAPARLGEGNRRRQPRRPANCQLHCCLCLAAWAVMAILCPPTGDLAGGRARRRRPQHGSQNVPCLPRPATNEPPNTTIPFIDLRRLPDRAFPPAAARPASSQYVRGQLQCAILCVGRPCSCPSMPLL
jgi:hypothetical protein